MLRQADKSNLWKFLPEKIILIPQVHSRRYTQKKSPETLADSRTLSYPYGLYPWIQTVVRTPSCLAAFKRTELPMDPAFSPLY
jgi:hypothetical protein